MVELFWITVGVGGVWVLVFLGNIREFKRTPRLSPRPVRGLQQMPKVSILVPARNEENNIRACLRSLMDQLHPDLEIIVADDRSTDGTAQLVTNLARLDPRIRLISLKEKPPPGWMGKCNALHQAFHKAQPSGEWLLFTDADTVHHPQALSVALREALDHQADMISLIPHLKGKSFWERLVQPSVAALIAMFNRPSRINNQQKPDAFANGQYILIRKEAYLSVGGHEAVAGKVLEDVEFAKVVKRVGNWIRLAVGLDLFQTRMYENLGSLVQGWTKNFFMLLRSRVSNVVIAIVASLVLSVYPTIVGLGSLTALALEWHPLPRIWLVILVAIYAEVIIFQWILRLVNRWYPAYAPLAPLSALVALFILVRSTVLHLGGRKVTWKGRRVTDDRELPP